MHLSSRLRLRCVQFTIPPSQYRILSAHLPKNIASPFDLEPESSCQALLTDVKVTTNKLSARASRPAGELASLHCQQV